MNLYNLTPNLTYNSIVNALLHRSNCWCPSKGEKKTIESYIFGSSIWKIPMKLFKEGDDIDWLFSLTDKDEVLAIVNTYTFPSNVKKIIDDNVRSIITQKYDGGYTEKNEEHYEVVIPHDDSFYKIDLVFVESMTEFINSMSDFDSGMLLYKCGFSHCYFVGHNYGTIKKKDKLFDGTYATTYIESVGVKEILNSIKEKRIEFNFYNEQKFKTTFIRLHKLLHNGFTIDCEKYASAIIELFNKSFCYEIKDYHSKHERLFNELCFDDVDYNVVKTAIKHCDVSNALIDKYICYALMMRDFDEAIASISKYSLSEYDKIYLRHIPSILGYYFSFNQLITFYNTFVKHIEDLYYDSSGAHSYDIPVKVIPDEMIKKIPDELIAKYGKEKARWFYFKYMANLGSEKLESLEIIDNMCFGIHVFPDCKLYYRVGNYFSSEILKMPDGLYIYDELVKTNEQFDLQGSFLGELFESQPLEVFLSRFTMDDIKREIKYLCHNRPTHFLIKNPLCIESLKTEKELVKSFIRANTGFVDEFEDNLTLYSTNLFRLNKYHKYDALTDTIDKITKFDSILLFYNTFGFVPLIEPIHFTEPTDRKRFVDKLLKVIKALKRYDTYLFVLISNAIDTKDFNIKTEISVVPDYMKYKEIMIDLFKNEKVANLFVN